MTTDRFVRRLGLVAGPVAARLCRAGHAVASSGSRKPGGLAPDFRHSSSASANAAMAPHRPRVTRVRRA